jgi:hypothetical protein
MPLSEKSKLNLVLCELHFTPIHGKTEQSCLTIEGHYLLIAKFDGLTGADLDDEEEDDEEDDELDDELDEEDDMAHIYQIQQRTTKFYTEELPNDFYRQKSHKLIRNYHNIIRRSNYIKPEIAECIALPTGENIAIIKTMWIKIIQRKWKKVYAARQHIIKCRSCPSSLSTRQLTGLWPQHCRQMPNLKGMLKGTI